MRQEDVYNLEGDTMRGTIYNQEPTSEPAFRSFLRKAKTIPSFLPPWWTDEKTEECVRFGLRDHSFSLAAAQEKSDIQEKWADNQMPMKLRMLGEKVYGNTPGGTKSGAMLGMMMGMEGGTGPAHTTNLDMRGLFRGTR
ncbi:Ankyrin repeat and MYND domain-containing protein 2 [Elasticomyces elasticus]|nr:Ankyrin repeat and MYND domain-containing protein 2 [Elasticomyces elasticus]KAK3666595.1 Ankyrin repeat and MYND domain-containing protein 2 [Elasticomyces elasticus]KAK4928272.1 Ankyrin repeat and MYND domain-containing protein 2 [Elasticomyces elasticus]KAK5763835.1 Ankyrin repeat and MYND domain-containing protein 2 [Elasticomyces elasticus]